MDGYAKLVVGCAIFIPLIAVVLVAAWKNWHGKWLVFADFAYVPGEGSEILHRRKGRRAALLNLAFAAYAVGMLGSSALSAVKGAPVNTVLWTGTLVAVLVGGAIWIGAASRRDAEAVALAATGEGSGLAEEYVLDARHAAALVIVIFAILAVEIGGSLIV